KFVAEDILQQRSNADLAFRDFAILYRTNAQSRALEEALRKLNVPYKIYGGTSFYQRKEIKDLIAYFRVTFNPNDEEAIKRVINYPRRGIGDTTIDRMIVAADQHQTTLWEVISNPGQFLDGRSANAIDVFGTMIKSFQALAKSQNAFDLAMHIAQHT